MAKCNKRGYKQKLIHIVVFICILVILAGCDVPAEMPMMTELPIETLVPSTLEPVEPIATPQVYREPEDKEIDEEGIIYNINKTMNMGMTTLEIKRVKVKKHHYRDYLIIMEYELTNNTDEYIMWDLKKDYSYGKLSVNEKSRDFEDENHLDDEDINCERRIGGSLNGKEKLKSSVVYSCYNPLEDENAIKENMEMFLIFNYRQKRHLEAYDDREFIITLNETGKQFENITAEGEYLREAVNRDIDYDGITYVVNKTFDMGQTTITIKNLKIDTDMGYCGVMEYVITNKTDAPLKWKFFKDTSGNMMGTIVTEGREKEWMGGRGNYTNEKGDKPIHDRTLAAGESIESYAAVGFDTDYEELNLKENEPMHFTIYFNQNGVDSEFSFTINENQ